MTNRISPQTRDSAVSWAALGQAVRPAVTHHPLQTHPNAQDCRGISAFKDIKSNLETARSPDLRVQR